MSILGLIFCTVNTNHVNWLICQQRSCLCKLFLTENKQSYWHCRLSNYVVVLQFFACNIEIIAINSSCNNRMSQIQYPPTLALCGEYGIQLPHYIPLYECRVAWQYTGWCKKIEKEYSIMTIHIFGSWYYNTVMTGLIILL